MGTPEDVAAENYFTPPEEVKSKMKVSEAIEVLTRWAQQPPGVVFSDELPAVKLGIEALKRVRVLRASELASPRKHLTGETPEEEVK
ncbi:unnamed protein product [marine sediment metagenome]|uniref:Uncharacterized protein n=1 Tax=marine sediment metagenome TaxID=412755 RepID=X1S2K1_9ZZZZ